MKAHLSYFVAPAAAGFLFLALLTACGREANDAGNRNAGTSGQIGQTGSTSDPAATVSTAHDPLDQNRPPGDQPATQVTSNSLSGLTPEGQDQSASRPPGKPVEARTADEALADRIKVAISTGTTGTTGVVPVESLAKEIHVTVLNGEVTLEGVVASEQEKNRIAGQVQAMEGVRTVNNQLKVAPPGTMDTDAPALPKHGGQK